MKWLREVRGKVKEMLGPFSITLKELPPSSVLLGSDKGALPFGSERPRHEVKMSQRWVMDSLVSQKLWKEVMADETLNSEKEKDVKKEKEIAEGKSWQQIEEFLQIINKASEEEGLKGEWRLPSEAEWQYAENFLKIYVPKNKEELLADHPHPNYRNSPTDGRPRLIENPNSMMRLYRVSRMAHPKKMKVSVKSHAPIKNGQKGQVFRLIFIPSDWIQSDLRVPEFFNLKRFFFIEGIIALVIGVIPSFTIPILRGMGSYALTGWVNLLFGGLCIAFASSLFWRPRTPTWIYSDDGKTMQARRLNGKKLLR